MSLTSWTAAFATIIVAANEAIYSYWSRARRAVLTWYRYSSNTFAATSTCILEYLGAEICDINMPFHPAFRPGEHFIAFQHSRDMMSSVDRYYNLSSAFDTYLYVGINIHKVPIQVLNWIAEAISFPLFPFGSWGYSCERPVLPAWRRIKQESHACLDELRDLSRPSHRSKSCEYNTQTCIITDSAQRESSLWLLFTTPS
jgi:hypothetical protein